ncbi:MAG: NAD(P)/FAD-dependent oxidoreductase [Solirubrobacterales bacterium]
MPQAGREGAQQRFDVVIVGARCAGAALAQRLAAAGLSVALLDAAKLPSDQRTSTHLIHPPGMDELDALGVGDAVRQASPALSALRLSYDGCEARLPNREGRSAHCLRREILDGLLQQAAVDSGVELFAESRAVDLIRDEQGRVAGVVTLRRGRITDRVHADLVVGADGRNSTLAKLVGANEYLGYEAPRAVYWAYWRRPSAWNPHEFHNTFEGVDARVIFPTDGEQLLIATVPPIERARAWRGDHTAAYLADIRAYGLVSPYLGDELPIGGVRGVLKCRYFFRTSAGPGWALVGDAGHHKEFVVGLGITDALRDARGLADAIVDGSPRSVESWWRRRDAERIEMFHWSRELGDAQPVNSLQRLMISRLANSADLQQRFGRMIDGQCSPYDLIPPLEAARWVVATAFLGGDGGALSSFLSVAMARARARRSLHRCKRKARRSESGKFRAGAPIPG